MRRSLTILLAASVTSAGLSGCVQTKQYADLQFTPPQGDYRLLVLRPDVSVGLATTGGIFEQRADWTDAARTAILASLRAQQGARGGQLLIADRRTAVPGVDATTVAELERLNSAVDQAIAEHKYGGQYLPTKRRLGLDYTLGEDAVTFGRKTGFDYMMFLHAEDEIASTGRVAMQIVGLAGCIIGSARRRAGAGSWLMPAWSTFAPAKSSGSTSSRPAARSPAWALATSAPRPAPTRWSSGCSAG